MTGLSNILLSIDGRSRLASVIAKYLLQDGKVAVVRFEELNFSRHFYKNKINYLAYLCKHMATLDMRSSFAERSTFLDQSTFGTTTSTKLTRRFGDSTLNHNFNYLTF
ncbi:60S ribosomal protein L13a-like [Rhagoletis pomonella]|uniref:60S ribosomal protein L13a-like n=1 Tax=Rhagoletis pomonella TaxID=28610 RepID=UPI00177E2619|nr:60S ribosomal protein L13a-like [Rhagoletis pomonella]